MDNIVKSLPHNRWSTPVLLRGLMLASLALVAFFYFSIATGLDRHNQGVKTLAEDASGGILSAQSSKSSIAEMNEIAVQALITKPGSDTYAALLQQYANKHWALTINLGKASEHVVYGAAQEDPINDINYVLASYHTLITEAFAAHEKGDDATARADYLKGRDLVSSRALPGTLLSSADELDKANTYALNQNYQNQQGIASHTVIQLELSGLALLAVLVVAQVFYRSRFRRRVSFGLFLATLLALGFAGYSYTQFQTTDTSLASAKDDEFDQIHILARANASAIAAREAEFDAVLDPAHAAVYQKQFDDATHKLVMLPAGMTYAQLSGQLQSGSVPDDMGGYLATVLRQTSKVEHQSAASAVDALGAYVASVHTPSSDKAFTALTDSLAKTKSIKQAQFDAKAAEAANALQGMAVADLAIALILAVFIFLGINPRLKEYKAGM
jgi:hypothetical protein